MDEHNMKSPLLDVVGFLSLLVTLPWLSWLLENEPYMRAIGSYGAAVVVVWRGVVLLRRAWVRRRLRQISGESDS